MNQNAETGRELLNLLAHELRSPMSVIAGYLRLLQKSGHWDPSQEKYFEEAGRCCARVMQLAQELDQLSTLVTGDSAAAPGAVSVFALCEEVADSIRRADGGQPDLVFTCVDGDRSARVAGDAARLKQAVASFIAATRRELIANQPVEIYGFVERVNDVPSAVIAVGAAGLATKRNQIVVSNVAPFNRWRSGMGLSVAIASRIIETHGGRLWSVAGDSRATMAFSLPLMSND